MLIRFFIVKGLVGTFNMEEALIGDFSGFVKVREGSLTVKGLLTRTELTRLERQRCARRTLHMVSWPRSRMAETVTRLRMTLSTERNMSTTTTTPPRSWG